MGFSERLGEWSRRLRNAATPQARLDQDLEEEMRLHRDLRARELRALVRDETIGACPEPTTPSMKSRLPWIGE